MLTPAPLSERTCQRVKNIGLDLWRSGGRPRDLIHLPGLPQDQSENFMTAVHEHTKLRKRVEGHPILIPPTGPTPYASFVVPSTSAFPTKVLRKERYDKWLPTIGDPTGPVRELTSSV